MDVPNVHPPTNAPPRAASSLLHPQVITIAGVFFQIVYLWYYDKWAAVVPLSIELCFLVCLLGLKFRLEYNPKGAALGNDQD